jgi:hypothetical protein
MESIRRKTDRIVLVAAITSAFIFPLAHELG